MAESPDYLLAGEYVLGTLEGAEKAAFEQRMAAEPALQVEVVRWQEHLAGLYADVPEQQPSPVVWQRISAELDRSHESAQPAKTSWWQALWIWRTSTALAVLGLLAVWLLPLLPTEAPEQPWVYSVVMRDQQAQPQWAMVCDWRTRKMQVERVAASPKPDRDFELWLLPTEGAPVSMGVLRGESLSLDMPDGVAWNRVKAFAVSLEPQGGSRQAGPSGPVLYSAAVPLKKT